LELGHRLTAPNVSCLFAAELSRPGLDAWIAVGFARWPRMRYPRIQKEFTGLEFLDLCLNLGKLSFNLLRADDDFQGLSSFTSATATIPTIKSKKPAQLPFNANAALIGDCSSNRHLNHFGIGINGIIQGINLVRVQILSYPFWADILTILHTN
jgi:hypothetical protein